MKKLVIAFIGACVLLGAAPSCEAGQTHTFTSCFGNTYQIAGPFKDSIDVAEGSVSVQFFAWAGPSKKKGFLFKCKDLSVEGVSDACIELDVASAEVLHQLGAKNLQKGVLVTTPMDENMKFQLLNTFNRGLSNSSPIVVFLSNQISPLKRVISGRIGKSIVGYTFEGRDGMRVMTRSQVEHNGLDSFLVSFTSWGITQEEFDQCVASFKQI